MTAYEKVVTVGGQNGWRLVEVLRGLPRLMLPKRIPLPATFEAAPIDTSPMDDHVETYTRRALWHDGKRLHGYMVLESISDDEALAAIVSR